MSRKFPEELLNLECFLLWQRIGCDEEGKVKWTLCHFDGTEWQRSKHWKERPKHTLDWLLESTETYIDQLDERGNHKYHIAMVLDGSGFTAIDFDYSKYDDLVAKAQGDAEKLARYAAGKAAMDSWFDDLRERTFVEESKSAGNFHALLKLKRTGRNIQTEIQESKVPLDCLGRGLFVLTGFGNELPIEEPSEDDLDMIERFWPASGVDVPFGMMDFGGHIIDLDPVPLREVADAPYSEVKDAMIAKNPWLMTGEGNRPAGELHSLRMQLMGDAAEHCYGMPSAAEYVWDILNDSHLPEVHATESESNRDRFTNPSKLRYMRDKEVAIAMGLAHKNKANVIEFERATRVQETDFEQQRKAREAAAAPNLVDHLTRGIKLEKAGQRTRLEQFEFIRPFDIPALDEFFQACVGTCAQTELGIAFWTVLAHAGGSLNRLVYTKKGLMTQSAQAIIAPQAIGKNIINARQRLLKQVLGEAVGLAYRAPLPGSDNGYMRMLPTHVAANIEASECGTWLSQLGSGVDAQRGALSRIRQGLTATKNDSMVGTITGKNDASVVHSPSLGMIVEGTLDQVIGAFSEVGEEDGTLRRMRWGTSIDVLLVNTMQSEVDIEDDDDDDDDDDAYRVSDRVVEILKLFHSLQAIGPSVPRQYYVKMSREAKIALNEAIKYQNERMADAADEKSWRFGSYVINVNIIAMTLAVWRAADEAFDATHMSLMDSRFAIKLRELFTANVGMISGEDMTFARMVVDSSVRNFDLLSAKGGMFMGAGDKDINALFDILALKKIRNTLPAPFMYSTLTGKHMPAYFAKQKSGDGALRAALFNCVGRGLLTCDKTISQFSMHGARFTLTPDGNDFLLDKMGRLAG